MTDTPTPTPTEDAVAAAEPSLLATIEADALPVLETLLPSLAGRITAVEGLAQELVDFVHRLFPGHGAPGKPTGA